MLCITKKNNTFGNKGIPRTAEEMLVMKGQTEDAVFKALGVE